jgi:murein DD-endopeptidase MepM/ murein hydrolase activator NlpD
LTVFLEKEKSRRETSSSAGASAPASMRRRAKGGSTRRGKPPKVSVSDGIGCVPSEPRNFVADAGPGCVIAHSVNVPWALGSELIDLRDYDRGAVFPDLAVDPESGTLSVVNATGKQRVAYITVYDHPVLKKDGTAHTQGRTVSSQGVERACVTFILLLPPRAILHAATLTDPTSEIDSDVQDWSEHPTPEDTHTKLMRFPLKGGPYLCTQGENGHLTHFFAGNTHAIDFRCPVGTDLLAVADARVVTVKDDETCSGIATANLFKWNSVMLKILTDGGDFCDEIDDGATPSTPSTIATGTKKNPPLKKGEKQHRRGGDLFVEYVHVNAGSVCVSVGDFVKAGTKICESGSVGFSPEPHLHFTAFRSDDASAATTRVRFFGNDGCGNTNNTSGVTKNKEGTECTFLPTAGRWYDATGEVPGPGA